MMRYAPLAITIPTTNQNMGFFTTFVTQHSCAPSSTYSALITRAPCSGFVMKASH